VTAEFWITQAFNGLSYGALLFLLASGLSLIFGVMRIVNLAHGSYFMLGGYVGLSVVWRTGSYTLALVAGAVALALVGIAMERLFLRRLSGQTLGQVLMTIGFALIFQDLALLIWGGDPYTIRVPAQLSGVITAGPGRFPIYRIFIVVVAVVVGAVLWLALDRTRIGAMIRAAVDDAEMAQGVGIRVSLATIYNTLHQFTATGLMREIVVDSQRSYFDTNVTNHHHFFYESSGRLQDIPAEEVRVARLPGTPAGTRVSRVDVVVRLAEK